MAEFFKVIGIVIVAGVVVVGVMGLLKRPSGEENKKA